MATPPVSQTIKLSCLKYFQHAKAKIGFVFGEFGEKGYFPLGIAALWTVGLHNLATRLGLHVSRAAADLKANHRVAVRGARVAPDRGVRGMGVSGATSAYRGVGGP
jgi:hypothetical protein